MVYPAQAASENGGSPILSYELQVDNGFGGEFISLTGGFSLETAYLFEDGVTSGSIFRFRYRSRNVNGWGDFSDISHLKAATVPQRPAKPTFVTADSTSLTIALEESILDGGQLITEYEVFAKAPSGEWSELTSYDGMSSQFTIATDELTAGVIYRLKYRAVNAYGVSDFSEELQAAISSFPAKPFLVRKVSGGESFVTLEWDTSADTELPVIGYNVYVNDG